MQFFLFRSSPGLPWERPSGDPTRLSERNLDSSSAEDTVERSRPSRSPLSLREFDLGFESPPPKRYLTPFDPLYYVLVTQRFSFYNPDIS